MCLDGRYGARTGMEMRVYGVFGCGCGFMVLLRGGGRRFMCVCVLCGGVLACSGLVWRWMV